MKIRYGSPSQGMGKRSSVGTWKTPYDTSLSILGDETLDGAVLCFLNFRRKQAPWNLPESLVIGDTFATLSLLITGLVGTHAVTLVEFEIAFRHGSLLFSITPYWLFPLGRKFVLPFSWIRRLAERRFGRSPSPFCLKFPRSL